MKCPNCAANRTLTRISHHYMHKSADAYEQSTYICRNCGAKVIVVRNRNQKVMSTSTIPPMFEESADQPR